MGGKFEVSKELEHPVKKEDLVNRKPEWKDILPYFTSVIFVVSIPIVYHITGYHLLPIWIGYAVLPFIDLVVGNDNSNVSKKFEEAFEKDWRFLIPMYTLFICDFLIYIWGVYLIAFKEPEITKEVIIIMFCMAHSSGFTGLMGHELFHRRFWLHKLVGTISMCKFFYGHFVMEHCAGHHINVGTLEDPATARRGESYYKFLFRSSLSGIKDAFNREVERAERWGHSGYGLYNKVIFLTACQTFWILLMIYFFGQRMILLHLIYILLPIALLEGANYVEHYGIERKKINKNYYESINHLHSWNTPHKVTNYLSFRLQRHSDHHVHSYRPYQTLRSYEVSPQLPFGYETCITMSLIPSLWFKVMNPKVDALNLGKVVDPKKAEENARIGHYFVIVKGIVLTAVFLIISNI